MTFGKTGTMLKSLRILIALSLLLFVMYLKQANACRSLTYRKKQLNWVKWFHKARTKRIWSRALV